MLLEEDLQGDGAVVPQVKVKCLEHQAKETQETGGEDTGTILLANSSNSGTLRGGRRGGGAGGGSST
jgi:hypothetical protein